MPCDSNCGCFIAIFQNTFIAIFLEYFRGGLKVFNRVYFKFLSYTAFVTDIFLVRFYLLFLKRLYLEGYI